MFLRFREKIQTLLRQLEVLPYLSGILVYLVFPKPGLYFLFPVAYAPLFLYLYHSVFSKKTLAHIYFAAVFNYLLLLNWIFPALYRNGAGVAGAGFALAALVFYLSIFHLMFSCSILLLKKKQASDVLLIIGTAAFWTVSEQLRGWLFSGFPWLLSGYSITPFTPLLQIASITGVYGAGFFVAGINAVIAMAMHRKKAAYLVVCAGIIISVYTAGEFRIRAYIPDGEKKTAALLQGNISQYKKWDSSFENDIYETYRTLFLQAAASAPDIIAWPETALPDSINSSERTAGYIREMSEQAKGSVSIIGSTEDAEQGYYNSAYSVSEGSINNRSYRKIRLVPFGEYIPFRNLLSRFFDVINEVGDFNPGNEYVFLGLPPLKPGIFICFESIFPEHAAEYSRKGANFFINLTNDGWYLKTAGAHQHMIHSIMRSVECGRYTLRAANTGISAIISPTGRILKETPLMEKCVLNGDFFLETKNTLFVKHIIFFKYIYVIIGILILSAAKKFRYSKE